MKKTLTLVFVLFFAIVRAQLSVTAVACEGKTLYLRAIIQEEPLPVHDISTTTCPDGSVHMNTQGGDYLECRMAAFLDAACTRPIATDPRFFAFARDIAGSEGTAAAPAIIYNSDCTVPLPPEGTYDGFQRTDISAADVRQCTWNCTAEGGYNCYTFHFEMPQNYNIVINCCYVPSLLAVQLVSFEGLRSSGVNTLRWGFADTSDFSSLDLERSFDAVNYSLVYSSSSAAVSSHSDLTDATAYYRLRVYNSSGGWFYSPVVVVKASSLISGFSVLPSPFGGSLRVSVTAAVASKAIFRLLGVDGREVFHSIRHVVAGVNAFTFDVPVAARGVYIFSMTDGEGVVSKKVIKN